MRPIALVSATWPFFNRPSIQLGSLKAAVTQDLPHIEVHARHMYLHIARGLGCDLYAQICEKTWIAEPLYAALLYGERTEVLGRFWHRRALGNPSLRKCDFKELCGRLHQLSQKEIDKEDWSRHLLVGFSICYSQVTSSLYFIREIKRRAPSVKVVVGGSSCAGEMGLGLLRTFSEIDFLIQGEGEIPFVSLVRTLCGIQSSSGSVTIPGLITRRDHNEASEFSQTTDLNHLPIPDYDEYFAHLRSFGSDHAFYPRIPMEISRGCWWRKRLGPKEKAGCAFCNLNLQWQGYRAKSQARVAEELDFLTQRYQVLSTSFMDNLLPSTDLECLFEGIRKLGKDFRLFAEIRANTSMEELVAMGAAGMREVQVGIESLSSTLLKKMNKGSRAIQNLEIMKNCEIPGLPSLMGNLILDFPSSDEQDVSQTLTNLDFALPFRPLRAIPFWLGYGSPVWHMPEAFGIKRVQNHPFYAHLFPPAVLKGLTLMIQGYRGCIRRQQRLWRPVKSRIEAWTRAYHKLHEKPRSGPILSYQDGKDFLIIRHRRLGKDPMTHRLQGTSRKIYLFCQTKRGVSEILGKFQGLPEDKAVPFFRMMAEKRLMFAEEDEYLSLAVPVRTPHIGHPLNFS